MPETVVRTDAVTVESKRVERALSIEEARNLLDWLESHELSEPDIKFEETGLLSVTWSERPLTVAGQ